MKIEEAQEQIVEMLQSDLVWEEKLNSDCEPGIYGVQDCEVSICPTNVWVDFPKMEFSFKDAELEKQ
jgi:hypothetical protein